MPDRLKYIKGMTFIKHYTLGKGWHYDWKLTLWKLGHAIQILLKGTK